MYSSTSIHKLFKDVTPRIQPQQDAVPGGALLNPDIETKIHYIRSVLKMVQMSSSQSIYHQQKDMRLTGNPTST
ncbi:unnamed protein product [Allacma fusca]|uniref:Uncharacterized protein n=1 Tax=Allacma fusca TaxID=39272 RepID=A0A8J2KYE2_9HEXA|nr:unnamed protein product [Allacma fusca]